MLIFSVLILVIFVQDTTYTRERSHYYQSVNNYKPLIFD